MRTFGIGIIGYGGIGRIHGLAYRSIPFQYGLPSDFARIVGVSRRRPEAAEHAAREAGCAVWVTDYRDLLARDDIDIVDICVPNVQHAEVIAAAAAAGKHVYCEKPLAMNVAEAGQISRSAEQAGIKAQPGIDL